MAYGQPGSDPSQASPPEQLLIWLREDLMGELQAINQYQAHIDNIGDSEIAELLSHIRDDEKEHVAELTHLIARVDAIQQQKFADDHTTAPAKRLAGDPGGGRIPTVGSLWGRK